MDKKRRMGYLRERIDKLKELETECAEAGSEKGVQGIDEDIEELERQYSKLVRDAEEN